MRQLSVPILSLVYLLFLRTVGSVATSGRGRDVPSNHKMGGLSPNLRDRVAEEMAVFTEALDAAMANPTSDALDKLRDAADQLMRATGRVLIELERMRD
jgi:hypothetical protein